MGFSISNHGLDTLLELSQAISLPFDSLTYVQVIPKPEITSRVSTTHTASEQISV